MELRIPKRTRDGPRPAEARPPVAGGAACVVWLTGLSGAGKSTVAGLAAQRLRDRGARVEVLDGDAARRALSPDLGFSRADRDAHVRRLAYVADLLSRNGVVVLVAAISPYRVARGEARALLGDRFVEVHVRASVAACAGRDVKGLYARALRGEIRRFTGVSDPYEAPAGPELVLDTEHASPEESAAELVAVVDARSRDRATRTPGPPAAGCENPTSEG